MATEWYGVDVDDAGEYTEGAQVARLGAAWAATGGSAPTENLEVLAMILDTAREQVTEYAPEPVPVVVDGVDTAPAIPARLVYAQLQQAINLWNAGTVSSAGEQGVDTYTFTPRPLDKTVRQIIRPISGFSHAL